MSTETFERKIGGVAFTAMLLIVLSPILIPTLIITAICWPGALRDLMGNRSSRRKR